MRLGYTLVVSRSATQRLFKVRNMLACSRLSVSGDDPRPRSSPACFLDRPHWPRTWDRLETRRVRLHVRARMYWVTALLVFPQQADETLVLWIMTSGKIRNEKQHECRPKKGEERAKVFWSLSHALPLSQSFMCNPNWSVRFWTCLQNEKKNKMRTERNRLGK